MKILKKGKKFVAYRDENDINNCMLDSRIMIGDSIGHIMIDSEKFIGNTAARMPLQKHLDKFKETYISEKQSIINEALKRIENDVNNGDLTAIDELLQYVPIKYLKGYL
jgi:hypothetical protein